jgi:cytochrome c2
VRVLLASTLALFATHALAQTATGAETFEDRCAMCHVAGGGGQGPSLSGIVGRHAGSLAGFTYSPALKGSGLTWTPANLDRFLTNPGAMVPGTAMMVRVNDAAQRAALIRYLSTQK